MKIEYFQPLASPSGQYLNASPQDKVTNDAAEALQKLGEQIRTNFSGFVEAVRSSDVFHPDELEVTMTLALEASKNWVILSGKASGTVGVKLKWKLKDEGDNRAVGDEMQVVDARPGSSGQ